MNELTDVVYGVLSFTVPVTARRSLDSVYPHTPVVSLCIHVMCGWMAVWVSGFHRLLTCLDLVANSVR